MSGWDLGAFMILIICVSNFVQANNWYIYRYKNGYN